VIRRPLWLPAWLRFGLAVLASVGGVVIQVLWRPFDALKNAVCAILVGMHAWPVAAGAPGSCTYGGRSVPIPPPWFDRLFVLASGVGQVAAIGAVGLVVYHFLTRRSPPHDEQTRCGWCGYILCGLMEPRCPECGLAIGERGAVGERVLVRAVLPRLGAGLLSLAFFVGLTWVMRPVQTVLERSLSNPWPVSWSSLGTTWFPQAWATIIRFAPGIPLTLVLPLAVALVVYHHVVFPAAWRDGRTRCGHCARVLPKLREPVCPACGERL
jgi:hypothetical protein